MKGPRITDAKEEPRGDDRRRSPTPPPPVASSVLSRPSHYTPPTPFLLSSPRSPSLITSSALHSRGAHVRSADVLHKVAVTRARRSRKSSSSSSLPSALILFLLVRPARRDERGDSRVRQEALRCDVCRIPSGGVTAARKNVKEKRKKKRSGILGIRQAPPGLRN